MAPLLFRLGDFMQDMQEYQSAWNEILRAVDYMIEQKLRGNGTANYNGIVQAANSDGTYNVQFNGEVKALKSYGSTPSVNDMVKVFVPQNNYNLAYFI